MKPIQQKSFWIFVYSQLVGILVVQQAQGVCCNAGRRSNNQLQLSISYYPVDEFLLSFLLLTSSAVILLGCISGLDIKKYQHSSKLWPLVVIVISRVIPTLIFL